MKPHLLIAQVDCDSEIALASHYKSPITSDLQNVYYKTLYVFKDIFRRHAIQGTFFVVGKDLESETKCETLNSLVLEGHEIANHTYTHPSNLSTKDSFQILDEIQRTNQICTQKLGVTPVGFRAPDFDINDTILRILSEGHFLYDCSTLATPWKPLLKMMKGQSPFASGYLGKWNQLHGPQKQYKALKATTPRSIYNELMEIPVPLVPYIQIPCNFSYLLALPNHISHYLTRLIIKHHVKCNTPLVLIFHLSDIVDNPYLFKTESMFYKSLDRRLFFLDSFLNALDETFTSITSKDYINLYINKETPP